MSGMNFDKFVKQLEKEQEEKQKKILEQKKADEEWAVRKLLKNKEEVGNNIVYEK